MLNHHHILFLSFCTIDSSFLLPPLEFFPAISHPLYHPQYLLRIYPLNPDTHPTTFRKVYRDPIPYLARHEEKSSIVIGFCLSIAASSSSENSNVKKRNSSKLCFSFSDNSSYFFIPVLLPYASIIDTFFSIVNHYFYHDNDYITNWEVKRNDKLFSTMGDHEQTGHLHLYTDS